MFDQSTVAQYPIFRNPSINGTPLTSTCLRTGEHNSPLLDLTSLYFDDNGNSMSWTPSSTQLQA
jgi:hypothetical protein